jgi:hypothetical protein
MYNAGIVSRASTAVGAVVGLRLPPGLQMLFFWQLLLLVLLLEL